MAGSSGGGGLREWMKAHATSPSDDVPDHNVAVEVGGGALLCMTCDERWEVPALREAPEARLYQCTRVEMHVQFKPGPCNSEHCGHAPTEPLYAHPAPEAGQPAPVERCGAFAVAYGPDAQCRLNNDHEGDHSIPEMDAPVGRDADLDALLEAIRECAADSCDACGDLGDPDADGYHRYMPEGFEEWDEGKAEREECVLSRIWRVAARIRAGEFAKEGA